MFEIGIMGVYCIKNAVNSASVAYEGGGDWILDIEIVGNPNTTCPKLVIHCW